MMDLRELIKWFIPCFHILLVLFQIRNTRLTFVCLFLLFNFRPGYAASDSGSIVQVQTKNLGNLMESYVNMNQSDVSAKMVFNGPRDVSEGRTFGRPFKKMMAGLIPVIFQLGAASTWAVLAALVGIKTLAVALFILKIILLAGAVKLGALFGQKGHHSHSWEPPSHHGWEHPQKEIHLHIHNGQPGHEEHTAYSGWSRNGVASTAATNTIDSKNINVVFESYSDGPQTINTPYGNYVKVQSPLPTPIVLKRK